MIIIEHEGAEYTLITRSGKLLWVDSRNQIADAKLSNTLITQASNITDDALQKKLKSVLPKLIKQVPVETNIHRMRKKKNGISIKINLKKMEEE